MSELEHLFFQRFELSGKEIPMRLFMEGTLIEASNLKGPKLIFTLLDKEGAIRDDLGLTQGSELTVIMGGGGETEQSTSWQDTFIVGDRRLEGDSLVIEALQKRIHELKLPLTKPRLFNDMTPTEILSELFPGCKIDCDLNDFRTSYHITSGAIPIFAVRQMARDYGAMCWLSRGVVHFKLINNAINPRHEHEFEYQGKREEGKFIIEAFQPAKVKDHADRKVRKNYFGWSTTHGVLEGKENKDAPAQYRSQVNRSQLDNGAVYQLPIIDCDMAGDTRFAPAGVVKAIINKFRIDSPIDESIPPKLYIQRVAHYQQGFRYRVKVLLGVHNAAES